jgi:hypothetical protein
VTRTKEGWFGDVGITGGGFGKEEIGERSVDGIV